MPPSYDGSVRIKKPAWMYYAARAQKQLGGIRPSEIGKQEVDWLYRTWRMASEKHGYPGLASDWETLVRRIGRGEIII
jgi:hypothetical protein